MVSGVGLTPLPEGYTVLYVGMAEGFEHELTKPAALPRYQ
jgi:hypothetical protein